MNTEEVARLPYRPCVGIVLVNRQGLIFAGRRIDMPGAWQMPQGGIDKGETADEAARRELEEEIGTDKADIVCRTAEMVRYDLPDNLIGKAWKGRYRGQEQHWFLMRFTGDDTDIDIATDHPEFDAWQWMNADDLVEGIVAFKKDIYQTVIDEFRTTIETLGAQHD